MNSNDALTILGVTGASALVIMAVFFCFVACYLCYNSRT